MILLAYSEGPDQTDLGLQCPHCPFSNGVAHNIVIPYQNTLNHQTVRITS